MESPVEQTQRKPHKPGSEKRRKGRRLTFRLMPAEYERLTASARDAGLTTAFFLRIRSLGVTQTRPQRRTSGEAEALARLQAEMNRIGGNIHQILKRVNFEELVVAPEYHDALAGYREVIDAILAALGRRRAA